MSLDFLDSVAEKVAEAKNQFSSLKTEPKDSLNQILKISPLVIDAWEYRDRQEFELGNIDDLAESIMLKGQAQPIVVVKVSDIFLPKSNNQAEYVVIAGYRRWLACKLAGINIEVIIKELSFDSAVACLIAENEKQSVSEYSKGIFFSSLLKREGVKKKVLYERLGITKTVFNNYLSFSEVPKEVWDAVGDLTKVTARTSGVIKNICQKGEDYKKAIISIASKISLGYAEMKIQKAVENYLLSVNNVLPGKNDTTVSFENINLTHKKNVINISFKSLPELLKKEFESGLSEYINNFTSKNKLK